MKNQTQILNWMMESLNNFSSQLALSKSRGTVESYRFDVARFLEYLLSKNIKRVSTIKTDHIVNYLGYCREGGKSDASINRYYMAIRSYFRFLRRTKAIDTDLTQDISPPKNHAKAPLIPNIEEIESIMQQPNVSTEIGLRDRAILELLYSSGLRASELCDLELKDLGNHQVIVRCGKRDKTRCVPVNEQAEHWIRLYIEKYRGKLPGFLFITATGRQLRRQRLCKAVELYAKKAGIEKVTTHTLRHACATHLLDRGADLRMIQEVLGHSSIASTQRYTHYSSSKIQSLFQTFHPRSKIQNL